MEKLDIDYLQCYINRNKDNKTPGMAEKFKMEFEFDGKSFENEGILAFSVKTENAFSTGVMLSTLLPTPATRTMLTSSVISM